LPNLHSEKNTYILIIRNMAYSILDYNNELRRYKSNPTIGPSSPGFMQGTANQIHLPRKQDLGINQEVQQQQPGSGQVLSATTQDTGSSGEDLAYQGWRAAIDQANRIRESGQATFDDLLRSVGAFRDRAGQQFTNAGQEIVNSSADSLASNARMGDSLATKATRRGRALGLGDSSKFRNQNEVEGNLAQTQGNVIARRGENERANQGLYDERLDQAQSNEDQANSYLRNINDSASEVEQQGALNYGGALDNLLQYQRQLSSLQAPSAGSIQQYSPDMSGIANTLNTLLSSMSQRPVQGGDMAANVAGPTNFMDILRKQRPLVQ